MTDQNFYENDDDDLIDRLRSKGVSEAEIVAALVSEDVIKADEVTVSDAVVTDVQESKVDLSDERTHDDDYGGEKPKWSHSEHHVLSPYRHNLTVDSGPEVEFINRTFGVNSDKFTDETTAEVRAWQVRKGLRNTGFVTFADYELL